MRGKGINEGIEHQRDAEEFARRYVNEEQGRNRQHVLASHKLQIKQAIFRKNQHYTGDVEGIPELTSDDLKEEVNGQIRREKASRKTSIGGKRRKTKRRHTKKR
jgi:hypothetical protein